MFFKELPELSQCQPFEYLQQEMRSGSKIGGSIPNNVEPRFRDPDQKYFGTIEFESGWAISIFYAFDITGNDPAHDIISYNNQILYPSSLIHAVVHANGFPEGHSGINSEVTCHQIGFSKVQEDTTEDPPEIYFFNSKVGGQPYIENASRVGPAFEELQNNNYRQLLQFDTPHPVKQSFVDRFPWDPGWLHVFVSGTQLEDAEFAFVIQQ